MIARAICEAVFRDAVLACRPGVPVARAIGRGWPGARVIGIAVGKAALEMARGAGPVARGVIVVPAYDERSPVPAGWRVIVSAHPEPDLRSVAAADAVIELVESAREQDVVLALVSGGASSLIERPAPGVTLDELRAQVRAVMASGASIREINQLRCRLSAIKCGKLAQLSPARVVTLAVSDVIGDDLAVIGSGPTIADRPGDEARVVVSIRSFVDAARAELAKHRVFAHAVDEPSAGDVGEVAAALVAASGPPERDRHPDDPPCVPIIGWGEPTVRVPADHGEGGRAQQLALELARRLRGTDRSAFVAGSDGIDGPPPSSRPAPAGAYVDGTTWDAIAAAGLDPERALERCDAGTALAAVGALVITGPTGINHADLMIVG